MTDYLYAKPSFIGGMARVLDLGGTMNVYNDSLSPEEADYLAIKSDWLAIGNDMRAAIEEFIREHGEEINYAIGQSGETE